MISIEKIAKEANVSSMTVSRVFDPRHVNKVKASTREKILGICKKHDYSPRYSARSLASGKTFSVGLVLDNFASGLSSPTMSQVINSIVKGLEKYSYNLNMIHCSLENLNDMNEKILETVYSRRVDGLLFFGELLTEHSVEKLRKSRIPAAILSLPSSRTLQEHISYVYADNYPATYDLVAHLKDIGVRDIAYLNVITKANACVDRTELFHREAEAAGLNSKSIICDYRNRFLRMMFDSFEWTLENWEKIKKYDAYVFSNDLMAIGGLKAMESKGLIAGRDKALAGFDNIEENINYFAAKPVITTIAPPHQELGEMVVKLLMEQINGNERRAIRLSLPSKLIIRSSTQRE
jgi:DNA-binding LacI/PurR family transcriptional regulator